MAIHAEPSELVSLGRSRLRHFVVIDEREAVRKAIVRQLEMGGESRDESKRIVVGEGLASQSECSIARTMTGQEVVVFSPLRFSRGRLTASVSYAEAVFQACRDHGVRRLVLLSSAEIYGADYSNPGMMCEGKKVTLKRPNRIAANWAHIESLAETTLRHSRCRLVILRPCWILSGDTREFASRLFRRRVAFPFAGYDPCIQLLSIGDLASAIESVVGTAKTDVYNIAPREVIPLREALRQARIWRIPVPYLLQRMIRGFCASLGMATPTEQMEFLRYPWTVSDQTRRDEYGVESHLSSAEAIVEFQSGTTTPIGEAKLQPSESPPHSISRTCEPTCDDFGMDEQYIRSCSRWQLGLMERFYWRVEVQGLEHVPTDGGAVLTGIHRGFMPFDGVMMVHLLSQRIGRIPRFLMHPGLVKFPHLAIFLTRLGGVIACQENADRMLRRGEIVGVFPEGIRGAFRMYDRDIYRIGKMRDDYVRTALQHRVPIVPFVAIGPAEIFPIVSKIESSWWKRHTHWPFFPITPTGNLIPLPTKWHIRILEPIPTHDYPEHTATDRKAVTALSCRVQHEMQTAIDEILDRRKSIFFGSVFEGEGTVQEPRRNADKALQPISLAALEARDIA